MGWFKGVSNVVGGAINAVTETASDVVDTVGNVATKGKDVASDIVHEVKENPLGIVAPIAFGPLGALATAFPQGIMDAINSLLDILDGGESSEHALPRTKG